MRKLRHERLAVRVVPDGVGIVLAGGIAVSLAGLSVLVTKQ